jgi:DNA-binding NarL/FixJ family response regulator
MRPRPSRPRALSNRSWRSSDVYLPDGDGFEVSARLAALDAAPAVVLTSSHDGAELAGCVAESGARGFVPKTELSREAIEELLG